jgi:hypothetical protein
MTFVIEYLHVASIGSAALCLLVGLLFIGSPGGWFRIVLVAVAVFAIAAPFYHLRTTLGMPSPWMEDGRYRLLGWKTDEEAGLIYVMVNHTNFFTPREFQIPFDLDVALALQKIREDNDFEELICMQYDRTVAGKPPVELQRRQAAVNDLSQSCDALWIDRSK